MTTQKVQNSMESAESEVKKWLQVALANENLQNLSIDLGGNSEKGDGYVGDIIFLTATGIEKSGVKKSYNLVLKCSKASAALMETIPVREVFVREMYVYEEIFPIFRKFQVERGIEEPFDSVPKCYGSYSDGFRYVIVLENLKKAGYDLWPKDKPLTRRHIDLTIKEYAKFHALSIAMKEQEPGQFHKLMTGLEDEVLSKFFKSSDFITTFQKTIEEIAELLKSDLGENILHKWLTLKDQICHVLFEMTPGTEDLHVIAHADCWSNNFLHKYEDDEKRIPEKVAMLDWQVSKYTSPVYDLSHFLLSCISEEDVSDMDSILRLYHNTLSDYATKLGSNLTETYPGEKLLEEWKKFGKYGLLMCLLPLKVSYSPKDDLPDMAKSAESGEDFSSTFRFEAKNKDAWKNRMRPIVRYAVDAGLI